MSEPNTESIFGTPLYYNELDNYEKVQQDFDEPLVNTTWDMNPQWGQTHYLSDPTFKEHLFEMYPLENFKKEIDKNLKLFCKSLNFNWRPYSIRSSWMAMFKKGNWGHCHHHGTSDIYGVYYLKKSRDDGDIYFESPCIQAQTSLCFFGGNMIVPAKLGGLILFPGWLKHGINMNNSDEERISVSFDITFNR